MLEVGARAPEFKLRSLKGDTVTLRDVLPTAPALLVFFKITCPVCQLTLPFLDRISAGLRVFGISQDDAEDTEEFNRRYGVTFPTLLDTYEGGYEASNAYGISTVPSLFLVERDGTISWTLTGFARSELSGLGARFGIQTFRDGEYAPEWKAG